MKLLSVVVPVYNVEKYIEKCVNSIINQTYSNLEIILVDDGSTDGSGKICDLFMKKDDRIKVIHKRNAGLSSARNEGIKVANGEYIAFVDSDDYLDLHMYSNMINVMQNTKSDISICNFKRVYENDKNVLFNKSGTIKEYNDSTHLLNDLLKGKINDYAWNKVYKKNLFNNIEYPLGKNFEDIGTTYKIFARSKKTVFIDSEYYAYLMRGNSITGSVSKKSLYDMITLVNERYQFLKNSSLCDKSILTANRVNYIYLYYLSICKFLDFNELNNEIIMNEYLFYKKHYMKSEKVLNFNFRDYVLRHILFFNKKLFVVIAKIRYGRK